MELDTTLQLTPLNSNGFMLTCCKEHYASPVSVHKKDNEVKEVYKSSPAYS